MQPALSTSWNSFPSFKLDNLGLFCCDRANWIARAIFCSSARLNLQCCALSHLIIREFESFPSGTVCISDEQTAGQGRGYLATVRFSYRILTHIQHKCLAVAVWLLDVFLHMRN